MKATNNWTKVWDLHGEALLQDSEIEYKAPATECNFFEALHLVLITLLDEVVPALDQHERPFVEAMLEIAGNACWPLGAPFETAWPDRPKRRYTWAYRAAMMRPKITHNPLECADALFLWVSVVVGEILLDWEGEIDSNTDSLLRILRIATSSLASFFANRKP